MNSTIRLETQNQTLNQKRKRKAKNNGTFQSMPSGGFEPPLPHSNYFKTHSNREGGHHGPRQLIWVSTGQIKVGWSKRKIREKRFHYDACPSKFIEEIYTFGAVSKATTAYSVQLWTALRICEFCAKKKEKKCPTWFIRLKNIFFDF